MKIVLGVTGGIAAYKAALLLRLFTEEGHDVTVVPTDNALRFVGAPTWEALSGKPIQTDVWSNITDVPHVRIGQEADLVVVAPATADLLARAATGLANDLLTNVLLTARCPIVLAPAMHTEMWDHPATVANVATLRARGVTVVEPDSGRLTGKGTGPGRLPEPERIHDEALAAAHAGASSGAGASNAAGPLAGRRVIVTSGGTREPLDPVRFLGNRSSGKQGHAIADVAARRGAQVTLLSANSAEPVPAGVTCIRVGSALELQEAVTSRAHEADVIVMAAAVADFRPKHYVDAKIKKTHDPADPDAAPTVELVRNPDILAGLVADRGHAPSPIIVGFAAETGDANKSVLEHGREKLARKGCDVLVVNEVGVDTTFGQDENTVHVLQRDSDDEIVAGPANKHVIAGVVWDVVGTLLPKA
ncbi:bifunctional phosphopantothenoylcysteine decarboxylase/phosphopantothenate--cysteine ligase CoaBC [Kribbia dieselivorans]|uniref:bifunctional phosphopantothenoylcysteine decarboxylase/phosphopantothenate--cysteine ligase CoaBC n=1 Tax=Kribbia dieselivorans TaxID=331526 RepID=UPI00083886AC|nr:bifunctional phosphopantothenoylcysteine decarboxylase/phosphopantothenate--cysteine ligase CoaBC [Kribbia dieselivorans]